MGLGWWQAPRQAKQEEDKEDKVLKQFQLVSATWRFELSQWVLQNASPNMQWIPDLL